MKPLPRPPPASPHEMVTSRVIDAPRERVFRAFTLTGWLAADATVDFPERIVDGDHTTVTFVAHAGRTTVIVRHAGAAAEGWRAALDRLAAELAVL